MKAAIYPGDGKPLVITEIPDPEPGPNDLIIRVHRCGICGTDLHMTEGNTFQFPTGSTPGHEFAGEVVSLGRKVTGWRSGDLLTALPSTGCGTCLSCDHGNWTLCSNAPGQMGGFAEYMRIAAPTALRLPSSLSSADGALIEPLAVGLYGVRQAANVKGSKVLVLGGGSVALCAIWWARTLGASKVVAVSRSNRRAEMACTMGADGFEIFGEDEALRIKATLGGDPDLVFECVGATGMLAKAISLVRLFGEVISMGFCTTPDPIVPALTAFKAVTLKFPVGYALADFEASAKAFERGHADPKKMISSIIGLDALPQTLDLLRKPNRETKVHVTIGSSS